MSINIINNINNINNINSIDKKAGKRDSNCYTIIVAKAKAKNTDIIINNPLDILLNSITIKEFLNNKKEVLFNLQRLNKVYVKGFIYRIIQGLYVFSKYKTDDKGRIGISFYAPQLSKADIDSLFDVLNYSNLSRNIINEPSNIFIPERLAAYACGLFSKTPTVKINNYRHADIKRMGLRLIDAVGGSSSNKPHFLVLEYKPANIHNNAKAKAKAIKTICLVGKGVTIDTGGYSMKRDKSMEKMYMDKEGAALSLGLFKYLVDSKSEHRIVCLCPLVENIVSSSSVKPNDVIKSYNGTSVEIVNTDAEGRLILADALAYACKTYEPDYIFDYATLTGWSERIHCHTSFTYFTLNDKLSKDIEMYNKEYAEKSIRLPPWVEYMYYIKSNIADVKNSGYKCVNSDGMMASLFLMNFIPVKYRKNWIHFDVRLSSYNNQVNIADGFATYLEVIKSI
jgi:leucyl aminopeptidase|uniref:Cytosol aminopeptidase domain-containing protein n=1 Tax=viral metagenome TaxID=1070528 RepID=A0A6C0CBZ1_9ZZZZ